MPVYFWILGFVALGLYSTTEIYFMVRARAGTVPWLRIAVFQIPVIVSWSLVAPIILRCARRVPFERARWLHTLRMHLLAMCGTALLVFLIDLVVWSLTMAIVESPAFVWARLPHLSIRNVYEVVARTPLLYAVIVATAWLATYYREAQERALQASELKAQLAQARLQSLKMQLNPHFLFNALNSVATLQRVDLPAAQRTLELLAGLLRKSLTDAHVEKVTLHDETAFLEDYLALEQIRFSNRLTVLWEMDPACLQALVPHLILQPLVENAVKHGFWPTDEPGTIWIRARPAGATLELDVEDDGMGTQARAADLEGRGIGIANTRARLAQLYGDAASLEVGQRHAAGFRATVRLPLEVSVDEPASESGG